MLFLNQRAPRSGRSAPGPSQDARCRRRRAGSSAAALPGLLRTGGRALAASPQRSTTVWHAWLPTGGLCAALTWQPATSSTASLSRSRWCIDVCSEKHRVWERAVYSITDVFEQGERRERQKLPSNTAPRCPSKQQDYARVLEQQWSAGRLMGATTLKRPSSDLLGFPNNPNPKPAKP